MNHTRTVESTYVVMIGSNQICKGKLVIRKDKESKQIDNKKYILFYSINLWWFYFAYIAWQKPKIPRALSIFLFYLYYCIRMCSCPCSLNLVSLPMVEIFYLIKWLRKFPFYLSLLCVMLISNAVTRKVNNLWNSCPLCVKLCFSIFVCCRLGIDQKKPTLVSFCKREIVYQVDTLYFLQ